MKRGPCPGGGTCCNRPLFDRTIFPCKPEDRIRQLEEKVRQMSQEAKK